MTKDKYLFRKKSQKFNPLLLGVVVILILVLVFQQSALQPMIVEAQVPKPAPPLRPTAPEFPIVVAPGEFSPITKKGPPSPKETPPQQVMPGQRLTDQEITAIQNISNPGIDAMVLEMGKLSTAAQVGINKLIQEAEYSPKEPNYEDLRKNLKSLGLTDDIIINQIALIKSIRKMAEEDPHLFEQLWHVVKINNTDDGMITAAKFMAWMYVFQRASSKTVGLIKQIPYFRTLQTVRTVALPLSPTATLQVSVIEIDQAMQSAANTAAAEGASATQTVARLEQVVEQMPANAPSTARAAETVKNVEKSSRTIKYLKYARPALNTAVVALNAYMLAEGRREIEAARLGSEERRLLEERQLVLGGSMIGSALFMSPWLSPMLLTTAEAGSAGILIGEGLAAGIGRFAGPIAAIVIIAEGGYEAYKIYTDISPWGKSFQDALKDHPITNLINARYNTVGNVDTSGRHAGIGRSWITWAWTSQADWDRGTVEQQEKLRNLGTNTADPLLRAYLVNNTTLANDPNAKATILNDFFEAEKYRERMKEESRRIKQEKN